MKELPQKIASSDAASVATSTVLGFAGGMSLGAVLTEIQTILSIISLAIAIIIGYYTVSEKVSQRRARDKQRKSR